MSVINTEYKHVFIHVPKSAGTSIESMPFVTGGGHTNLHLLAVKPDFDNSYFKWTIIRNPFDRIASAYFAMREGGTANNYQHETVTKYETLKDFIMSLDEKKYSMNGIDINIRYSSWNDADVNIEDDRSVHIVPVGYFTETDRTKIDFVGKFENLQEDFNYVCDVIGVNNKKLLQCNRTKTKPADYYSLYDEEMKCVIENIYAEEIAEFYS